MRIPEIWDDWVKYDDNGISGIRDDAPEDVKKAFAERQAEQKKQAENGLIKR